jgi:hypothetical protein
MDALLSFQTRKGVNWNDLPTRQKRGVCAIRTDGIGWYVDSDIPVFTQERTYLTERVPRQWSEAPETIGAGR